MNDDQQFVRLLSCLREYRAGHLYSSFIIQRSSFIAKEVFDDVSDSKFYS